MSSIGAEAWAASAVAGSATLRRRSSTPAAVVGAQICLGASARELARVQHPEPAAMTMTAPGPDFDLEWMDSTTNVRCPRGGGGREGAKEGVRG